MSPLGDRRNVVLEYPEADVALYTHWGGTEMPEDLKFALERAKPRWHDPAYCGRIIFSSLISNHDEETGWGIEAVAKGSDNFCESSDRDLYVNLEKRTVRNARVDGYWTFEEYVGFTDKELYSL